MAIFSIIFGVSIYACVGFTIVTLARSMLNKRKQRKENEDGRNS